MLIVPFADLDSSSFFAGAGFDVESPEVDRWGIFRISLYLDWLYETELAEAQWNNGTAG